MYYSPDFYINFFLTGECYVVFVDYEPFIYYI